MNGLSASIQISFMKNVLSKKNELMEGDIHFVS
jgi:hypothetical protein